MSDMKVLVSTNILPVDIRDIPTIMKGDKGDKGTDGRDGRDGSFVQKAYKTYASMVADKSNIPTNTSVLVNNDPDKDKNAYYTYDGAEFTKSDFDPQGILTTVDVRLNQAVESASDYFQSQVADTVATSINNSTVAYTDAINTTKAQVVADAKLETKEALNTVIENGGLPAKPFATKALMTASALVNGDYAMVTDDTVNNGLYVKTAGSWVKSTYDPVSQASADATVKADAAKTQAVVEAKLYVDDVNKSNIKGVVGKNLFDNSKVETGKGLGDTGATINAAGRNISGYIPVEPNTVYSFSGTTKVVFYDANKEFVQLSYGATANVTSASNAAFVRIDVNDANLNTSQVELGAVKSPYEPYRTILTPKTVTNSALQDDSVSSDNLQPMSVSVKHFADATFLNMHDASTLRKGITVNLTNGKTETPAVSYDTTAYIPCKPNTAYIANETRRVLFYRADGSFISASPDTTFITPSDCTQMRFTLSSVVSFRFQLNEGTVLPAVIPQPYKFTLDKLYVTPPSKIELSATLGRKINFSDAWYAWRNNEKFPIAFLGDSTTNGNGTTGYAYRVGSASLGQDFIAPNAYTQLFENYIRDITGNTVMRAYNAGFSGRNATWALANIDAIFGEAYADVKMIGISMGINDRTASAALYARNFYRDIEGIIQWCFNKGIQPFLLTSQPCTIPGWVGEGTGADIQEVANEIKKNLAAKYDLELIDVSKFGEQFMQYSTKPLLNNIMEASSNVIHFGDGGHKFTAELLFANFCKRCIWTTEGEQLDYATQLTFSDIQHAQIKQIVPFKQGFKVELNTTQTTAENKLLQEYWVFNAGRKQLDLSAYYANAAVGQYAVVDGVQTTITTQGQALGTLDLGLHKIKAYSSATTTLDWLGFKLTPIS